MILRPDQDPQNPYISCVVRASAGCGKTYQLSRRFLHLVATGADPSQILCLTFTIKAAAEMRERIIKEAARLIQDPTRQVEFDRSMKQYYQSQKEPAHKPLTAQETGEAILSCTQSLEITTIDAILMKWSLSFASEGQGTRYAPLKPNAEVGESQQLSIVNQLAWNELCQKLFDKDKTFLDHPMDLSNRIESLDNFRSFIYLCLAEKKSVFRRHKAVASDFGSYDEIISHLKTEFMTIIETLSSKTKDAMIEAVALSSLDRLIEARLVTKELKIHGNTVKGKKRDSLISEISCIEEELKKFHNKEKIDRLNRSGSEYLNLYMLYDLLRDKYKDQLGVIDFDDVSRSALSIFLNEDAVGARFLIQSQIQHLILDEFQDTSQLQWHLFRSIAIEILSGEGLNSRSNSSVFIVGDEKQSIYGFREADASILVTATEELADYGVLDLPLNHSYRTSQVILDAVNMVFTEAMNDFPLHQTARINHQDVVANHGGVYLSPLIESEKFHDDEAEFVARYLKEVLIDNPLTIYDKNRGQVRNLRPGDCAVLYRSSTHAGLLEQTLRAWGIESRRAEERGFFQRQEVRDMLSFVKYLVYQSDLLAFSSFIRSPLSPIDESLLLSCLNECRTYARPKERIAYCLDKFAELHPHYIANVRELLTRVRYLSPGEVLVRIFKILNPVSCYAVHWSEQEAQLASTNLQNFYELFLDLIRNGYISLLQVLNRLLQLAHDDQIGVVAGSSDVVQLMTVHKSKGLEFPLVIMVGLGEDWQKLDSYWLKHSHLGLAYVGTKSDQPKNDDHFEQLSEEVISSTRDEELRLLYVGMTRAMHYLTLVGACKKDLAENSFYYLVREKLASSMSPLTISSYELAANIVQHFSPAEIVAPQESSLIENDFAWSNLIQLSQDKSYSLEVETLAPARLLSEDAVEKDQSASCGPFTPFAAEAGQYIHIALEKVAHQVSYEPESIWDQQYLRGDRELFKQKLAYLEPHVENVLKSSVWKNLWTDYDWFRTEQDIVHLDGDKMIRGTIDLLLRKSSGIYLVVDYKTGLFPEESLEQITRAKRYDLQVEAYVRAVSSLFGTDQVKGGVFFTAHQELVMVN